MGKKVNTLLFILGATLLNIVMMILLMTIGLFLVSRIAGEGLGEAGASIAFMLVFVASIAGAFFIYHRIVRLISKRLDMDKHFHPIFGRRK